MSSSTFTILVLATIVSYTKSEISSSDDLKKDFDTIKEQIRNRNALLQENQIFNENSESILDKVVKQINYHCTQNGISMKNSSVLSEHHREIWEGTMKCFNETFPESRNETGEALINNIEAAIPAGELDKVFKELCVNRWPGIRKCIGPILTEIDKCWQELNLVKVIDSGVDFFCGEEKDGARIALFIAEGGISCMNSHGDKVRTCIEDANREGSEFNNLEDLLDKPDKMKKVNKKNLCKGLEDVHRCSEIFKKCNDPTPENLITSMLRQAGLAVECQILESRTSLSSTSSSSSGANLIPIFLTSSMSLFSFLF